MLTLEVTAATTLLGVFASQMLNVISRTVIHLLFVDLTGPQSLVHL